MQSPRSSQSGSSLIEVVIALGVLTVGALGAAQVFVQGMQKATSSPGDLIATAKAAEAVESVFSARDSHRLTWAQIRNVQGESGSDGGIFIDGQRQLYDPGPDGLVNTSDDSGIERVKLPGRDQIVGTPDDQTIELAGFRRQIEIKNISNGLRSITVTLTYQVGPTSRKYVLTTFISNYS